MQLLPVASKEVAQWYKATWPKLYKFVYHRVQNREEAQALTQEAYVNCLDGYLSRPGENRSSRPDQFPPPWSYVQTIALNLIRDRWRKRNRTGVLTSLEEWMLKEQSAATGKIEDVDRILIKELLDRLQPDFRRVLELRLIQGCSRRETARVMGRSEDAVRGLQYRALAALRSMLT